jgi:hypothetical protein
MFNKQKDLSRRQLQWLEVMVDFDFKIEHSPGKLNVFVDALSRIYSEMKKEEVAHASEYITWEEDDQSEGAWGPSLFQIKEDAPAGPIRVGNEVIAEMELIVQYPATHPAFFSRTPLILVNSSLKFYFLHGNVY